jgi:hypothetical protein
MANLSTYSQSGMLNYLIRGNSNNWAKPLNVCIALCSGVPAETCNGGNIPEIPNANGYARVNLGAPSNTYFSDWSLVSISGDINNLNTIAFPQATQNWGYVSGVAIMDSGVYGSGNMLMWGALIVPRVVLAGDTFQFNAVNLNIYLG